MATCVPSVNDARILQDIPMDDAIRAKFEGSKELNLVITGRYQVGKSTLINSLLHVIGEKYKEYAVEGSMEPTTEKVKRYRMEINGVIYNIYDTRGLQEKSDFVYLREIKKACPKVHLFIYCMKLEDPIRQDEEKALKNLTKSFGGSIWENMVIALTYANQVTPTEDKSQHFKEIVEKKTQLILSQLQKL